MGRIIERHRERLERPSKDWKDSRIVIAALSAAGTATFMSTVVIPVTTAKLEAKLEALAPADEKIKRLEKELAENKAELAISKSLVSDATMKSPFLLGSAYPVGLDTIQIGATREQLNEAFPNGEWTDGDYVSVSKDHPLFSSATYYLSGDIKNRRVTAILFHFNYKSPLDNQALKRRFNILFGQPAATGRGGASWWKATARETIEMDNGTTYSVHTGTYTPYWVKR